MVVCLQYLGILGYFHLIFCIENAAEVESVGSIGPVPGYDEEYRITDEALLLGCACEALG